MMVPFCAVLFPTKRNLGQMSQFLRVFLPILSNGFLYSNIYDKRDDFGFDIVTYLDGHFPVLPPKGLTFLIFFDLLDCLLT